METSSSKASTKAKNRAPGGRTNPSSKPVGDGKPTIDDLTAAGPIPHAYALVPAEKPGFFYAVHLENVYAEGVEHLDPNGEAIKPLMGINRIDRAMARRHRFREWVRDEK